MVKIWKDLYNCLGATSPAGTEWVKAKIKKLTENPNPKDLYLAFSIVSRHTGREVIAEQPFVVPSINWTADEIGRMILIMSYPFTDGEEFLKIMDPLFETSEIKELETLYKGLSILPYPDKLVYWASEGVRSNIDIVFDAIALNNPYPAKYFDENSWNQMIIKSVFIGKPLNEIICLDERRNKELARMALDLVHERWAAGRTVTPQLWRLVAPFLTNENILDLKNLLNSNLEQDRFAAILCIQESSEPQIKEVGKNLSIQTHISNQKISWDTLY